MLRELSERCSCGELSRGEVGCLLEGLLSPEEPLEVKAEVLACWHDRGETAAEIAALAELLLERAERVPGLEGAGKLLDVCGTGGDRAGFFNVSTAVMFVVAGCGVRVAKHGNRGITSRSGGADALEALGVPVALPPERVREFLEVCGFVFLFAPAYHPAFRLLAPVRQHLAARGRVTVFNLLGPLLNPARPQAQLVGIFQPGMVRAYAEVLRLLGRRSAWVVHGRLGEGGAGGLDEVSLSGPTVAAVLGPDGRIAEREIGPGDFGFAAAEPERLRGGSPAENAALIEALLSGSERGPRLEMVLANAAVALAAAGAVRTLADGVGRAREAVESGAAAEVLARARAFRVGGGE